MSATRVAFETIIAAVREFRPRWHEFLSDWRAEEIPWYLAMGELAHYVVEAYQRGNTGQFTDLFSAVESVLQNPDREIKNLVWVGLFENMQNVASHRAFGSPVFRNWLGPQSLIV